MVAFVAALAFFLMPVFEYAYFVRYCRVFRYHPSSCLNVSLIRQIFSTKMSEKYRFFFSSRHKFATSAKKISSQPNHHECLTSLLTLSVVAAETIKTVLTLLVAALAIR